MAAILSGPQIVNQLMWTGWSHCSEKYKEFIDLHGCKWAYNDEVSLSGNLSILLHLKRLGLNANFFGHIMHSGMEKLTYGGLDKIIHFSGNIFSQFLPKASFGLRVLSFPASVCVCIRLSVRPCINH